MQGRWALGLVVTLGCWTAAQADEVEWRAARARAADDVPAVTLLPPVATIGRPVPAVRPGAIVPVRAEVAQPVIRAQAPDLPPPAPVPYSGMPPVTAGPPPVGDPFAAGVPVAPPDPFAVGSPVPQASPPGGFWAKTTQIIQIEPGSFEGAGRKLFQSDHAFDGFISPVTNPFLFEDPRALTELRPIFLWQGIPKKNNVFAGGDIEQLALQGRVAITERFSIVLNKFGYIWQQPNNSDPFIKSHSGFAEVWVGPKWTFARCEETGTVGALGITFEIPAGPNSVGQNTGQLSVVPYLSLAQNFCRSSYGSFNGMGTMGYAFSTNAQRSENFFTSLHLDYDVGNLHKIYPLMEVNYMQHTVNGSVRPFSFEGGDLANFGSTNVAGKGVVDMAFGARYKFSEVCQVGTAVQFPLTGSRDLLDWRWTVDFIYRY